MNIAKPNKEDLDAVWELVAFLNKIEQGLNPIYQPADPEDEDDFEYLSVLDFSPKFKQAVKDTERLDFLMEVGSAEFSKQNGQKPCCYLTEYGIRGYGSNYREALDDVMEEWKGNGNVQAGGDVGKDKQ